MRRSLIIYIAYDTFILAYLIKYRATNAAPRLSGSELIRHIDESELLLFSMCEITVFANVINAYSFLIKVALKSSPSTA